MRRVFELCLYVSQNSEDSYYLKEMFLSLFPVGIGNATAAGTISNHSKRRNKKAVKQDSGSQPANKLDSEKLKYMKGINEFLLITLLFPPIVFMKGAAYFRIQKEWRWKKPGRSTTLHINNTSCITAYAANALERKIA